MRNELDFAPLYRSGFGFERVVSRLDNPQRLNAIDTRPTYNIVKTGKDDYRIILAVAGFGEGDLDITQERNVFVIKGGKTKEPQAEYLHCGIAGQSFDAGSS